MKEKVCVNCESVKVPKSKRQGSTFLCIIIWISFIVGSITGLLLAITSFGTYCILGVIMFIFCIWYTSRLVSGEKTYFCPVCGAANPLPPKSAKGIEILSKLQVKGDEDAIRIIGFIREEEKAKTKAGF